MKAKTYRDPVVEVYMRDVDRTLLRENLKLTYEERIMKNQRAVQMLEKLSALKKRMKANHLHREIQMRGFADADQTQTRGRSTQGH